MIDRRPWAQLTLTHLPGDVAISSASFILVSSQLRSLLTLIDLSRTVFNRVKFNFVRCILIAREALHLNRIPVASSFGHPFTM